MDTTGIQSASKQIKLQDFCNMERLFHLLEDWSKCTGLSAIVIDPYGTPISRSFGMSPFCQMVHDSKEGAERCRSNWKDNNQGLHQCHAGFYDFAIPILSKDGIVLGRILAGQMISNEQTEEEILSRIDGMGLDKAEVEKVLKNCGRKSMEEMHGAYSLLNHIVIDFIEQSYDIYYQRGRRKFDVLLLTSALSTVYRMSMHFNVTKNEYHLVNYPEDIVSLIPLKGTIEQIVDIGVKSIPDKDQAEKYGNMFNRNALMEAYATGTRELSLRYRQQMVDGHVHWMEGSLIFVEAQDGNIHAICLNRVIDDEVMKEDVLREALENSKKQQKLLQEALDNYKQADYDRRRDFLTGLRNRQDMFELFNDALSGKRLQIHSMFMMDIDNFKQLNDNYGHTFGDHCLMKIGEALNNYGKDNNMYFYRYGGEEMLGISFSGQQDDAKIANDLVKIIRDLNLKRDDSPFKTVTVSLGYTTDNSRYEKMVDRADKAMYEAKSRGKNQAVCYEDLSL